MSNDSFYLEENWDETFKDNYRVKAVSSYCDRIYGFAESLEQSKSIAQFYNPFMIENDWFIEMF